MGSGSEELIGSWCSCADSSEEVEGEGDRQEDMLRNVEVICVGNYAVPTLQTCSSLADRKERDYY